MPLIHCEFIAKICLQCKWVTFEVGKNDGIEFLKTNKNGRNFWNRTCFKELLLIFVHLCVSLLNMYQAQTYWRIIQNLPNRDTIAISTKMSSKPFFFHKNNVYNTNLNQPNQVIEKEFSSRKYRVLPAPVLSIFHFVKPASDSNYSILIRKSIECPFMTSPLKFDDALF